MKEIMSPNVTYLTPLKMNYNWSAHQARLHAKGVIEIDVDVNPGQVLQQVEKLFEEYERVGHLYAVSVTGLPTAENQSVGSRRFCAWDKGLAGSIDDVIKDLNILELIKDKGDVLQFAGVSKYFRFMRYYSGGQHFPHYDSDFVLADKGKNLYATKYSLVMYFNDCQSGELAFVNHDGVDKSDWARQADDDEIFLRIKPRAGKLVLFPHDLCHTVLPYTDKGYRYVVRGDLIFTRAEK